MSVRATALTLLALVATRAVAAGPEARRPFLVDRGSVEVVIASGGWRSGFSTEESNPGFSLLGGGGELVVGLDVVPGIGLVACGRVLAAPRLGGVYIEGLAGLGAQVRLSESVRLRVGIASGQARLDRDTKPPDLAVLLGGFVVASVDLFRLGRGRAAAETTLRLDIDGHLAAGSTFPRESIALSLGAGFRF